MRSNIAFMYLFLIILLTGCGPTVPQQRNWVNNLFLAKGIVAQNQSAGKPPMTSTQLVELLGPPDHKLSPTQLIHSMEIHAEDDVTYKTRIQMLLKDIDAWPDDAKCILWIYEEPSHFLLPLPYPVLFGEPEGFHAGIYVIRDQAITSCRIIDNWKIVH